MLEKQFFRMTRQRRVILEEIRKSHSHPSADEVYDMVRQRMPRISLGTIYRNLEILSALGEIRKLELSGNQKRFDGDPNHHYHIRCLRCNRLDNAPIGPLDSVDNELDKASDYDVLGHQLEFVGLCPQCSTKIHHKIKD